MNLYYYIIIIDLKILYAYHFFRIWYALRYYFPGNAVLEALLVKRITYHLREIWYALRHFREVDPVLLANPCDCPWREHLCGGLHAETCQNVAVLVHPAVKCSVTHSGSICQFVFVCAFHGLLFWLQTTDNRFVRCLFRYKVTKNKRIMQENLCLSFQIFSQVFNATLECRNFVS